MLETSPIVIPASPEFVILVFWLDDIFEFCPILIPSAPVFWLGQGSVSSPAKTQTKSIWPRQCMITAKQQKNTSQASKEVCKNDGTEKTV